MTGLPTPSLSGMADRFEIVREIGSGGMAIVYLAHDRKHDRKVALKVLRPELRSSVSAERFLREIHFAAQLQHPHILSLHDSGIADDAVFYVMPFVEGESLRDWLSRAGSLPVVDAVAIARQVADALEFAHERGVVHRDVKPENILLAPRGSSGGEPFALVADFGIARALHEIGGDPLTITGLVIGTPAYMSPEQAGGDRALDARSDVYSLGCVLYEMLCGHPPFSGDNARGVIVDHLTRTPPPIAGTRDGIPASVNAIVERALAKDPRERFDSAGAMAAALRAASDALVVPTRNRLRRLAPAGAKSRLALAAGVAALSLVATVKAVDGWPLGVAFTAHDWVVVADVSNQTGQEVFDHSLTSALLTSIQQSRHVNVVPRSRVREVLRLMEDPDTSAFDEAKARAVAQRIGSPVVLAMDITRVDSVYELAMRIIDPPSGQPLRTHAQRAEGSADVLGALDRLVSRARRSLNESSFAVRAGTPLPAVTTSSLDALKRFSDGDIEWNRGRYARAHQLFEQALQFDSAFAQAQVALGASYYFRNLRPQGESHFVKAEARLGALSERERMLLGARIAGWRGKRDEQISLLATHLAGYPRDEQSWYNLGTAYFRSNRCADALPAFTNALEIDSMHVSARVNSAICLAILKQPAAAVTMFRTALRITPALIMTSNLNHEFGLLLLQAGEAGEARRVYELLLTADPDQRSRGLRSLALLEMQGGHFDSATVMLREAIVQNRIRKAPISEYRDRLFLAVALQRLGRGSEMRAQLDTAFRLHRTTYLEPWLLAYAGRLLIRGGDLRRGREIRDTVAARVAAGNVNDDVVRDLLDAELARALGRPSDAVRVLEVAYGRSGQNAFVLEAFAEALADQGALDAAAARYRELMAARTVGWEAQDGGLLASYRLGRLAEAQADTTGARAWYGRFLDQWPTADATVVEIVQARRRIAALSGPG